MRVGAAFAGPENDHPNRRAEKYKKELPERYIFDTVNNP